MPKVFSDSGINLIPPNPPLKKGGIIRNKLVRGPFGKGIQEDLRTANWKEFTAEAIDWAPVHTTE
jgi:hypothetical protein